MVRPALAAVLVLALAACGARACSDSDDRAALREIEVLTGEPGGAADAAERLLIGRGAAAVPYLETGLYNASPTARRRVVRVLVKIGDPSSRPILEHLERRDPDADVRAAAAAGLARLAPASPTGLTAPAVR